MSVVKLNAQHYRDVALDHIGAARTLRGFTDERYYVLSHYVAGVAVECMLRAYYLRANPDADFDKRHDLKLWYVSSRFDQILKLDSKADADAALSAMSTRWQNDHRYHSVDALKLYFRRMRLDTGIKGDVVKELTSQTYEYASLLVNIGERGWNSWKMQSDKP